MDNDKKKILVVDDSEYNVEVISSHLVAEGYDVDVAYDGESGIQKVKDRSPDLILLDVMMPVLDGYEVCRKLKNLDSSRFTPIILITALSNPDDRVRGFEAGADDFLVKPLNSIEMLARIKNLLRSRELVEKQRRRDLYEAEIAKELDLREIRYEEEAKRRQFYKEVIFAVTNGKLRLLERGEIEAIQHGETELDRLTIRLPEDVSKARKSAESLARNMGFLEERIHDLALCVSEAATNVIKHGEHGTARIAGCEGALRIWIEDSGPGIEFTNLPKATLMRGFSTKPSFGYGFKIMIELLDTLFLCTDRNGTVLLMELNLKKEEPAPDIDQFLSSWQE